MTDDAPRRIPRGPMLDPGRQTRAMRWVMAVMLLLTVLAAALGLALASSARAIDADLGGRLTVQVIEPDAPARTARADALATMLGAHPMVAAVEPVPPERLEELLRPWLGEAGMAGDLPVPAMIDVTLRQPSAGSQRAVERAVRAMDARAAVDAHADWLAPVRRLIATIGVLAGGIVALMAGATLFVVMLAARAGLDAHRPTIDVMHMLGSTDTQVARLFQRRIGTDTLVGGLIGTACALGLVILIQGRFAALGPQALPTGGLGSADWAILAVLPIAFAALATLAARWTVLNALGRLP